MQKDSRIVTIGVRAIFWREEAWREEAFPLLKLSAIHCSTSGTAEVILESYAEVYSNQLTTGNSPFQLVQCSTVANIKKKKRIWYPSLITRNSSRARQPLSRVNVTGLLRRLQVKIENIYLFKILIKKHENVFKSWLCPNFLLLPKKSELPKIWGGCSPPRPPGPYAYDCNNRSRV